jgi:hypothetical protein
MATITKGYTFTSGETVEPADMHQLVDLATVAFTSGDDTDNASLEVSGNKFRVKDGGVTAAKLATTLDLSGKTLTLPNDSATTAVLVNQSVTPAKLSQPLTMATAQATTSGTSIDFTGIPSWVKRITVMLAGVSTNGSTEVQIQIGDSGGVETTDYSSRVSYVTPSEHSAAIFTVGFVLTLGQTSAGVISGIAQICNISGNIWVCQFTGSYGSTATAAAAGRKTLSDTLDRVRLTTVNGTATFNAGSVNIMYEG